MRGILKLINQVRSTTNSDYNRFNFRIRKYLCSEIKNISLVDAGANRGGFYDEIQSTFPEASIKALLIEPIPACVDFLNQKFKGNDLITICNEALSNIVESKDFFIYNYDEISSLLKLKNNIKELENLQTSTLEVLKLTTNTLDNIVQKHMAEKQIDILKIDVQGYENKALLGASESLKLVNFIWIEVSFKALYEGTCLFSEIHEILTKCNFRLLEISDGHRSPELELLQANCLYQNIAKL